MLGKWIGFDGRQAVSTRSCSETAPRNLARFPCCSKPDFSGRARPPDREEAAPKKHLAKARKENRQIKRQLREADEERDSYQAQTEQLQRRLGVAEGAERRARGRRSQERCLRSRVRRHAKQAEKRGAIGPRTSYRRPGIQPRSGSVIPSCLVRNPRGGC